MRYASLGDTVKVHLTAQLKTGETVYSTHGRQPFVLTLGQGKVMPGVEDAIEGMAPGEMKTVTLPAETTHEPGDATKVIKMDVGQAGKEPGTPVMEKQLVTPELIHEYPLLVSESSDSLLIDKKSPLAGEDLVFDVELLEILS